MKRWRNGFMTKMGKVLLSISFIFAFCMPVFADQWYWVGSNDYVSTLDDVEQRLYYIQKTCKGIRQYVVEVYYGVFFTEETCKLFKGIVLYSQYVVYWDFHFNPVVFTTVSCIP